MGHLNGRDNLDISATAFQHDSEKKGKKDRAFIRLASLRFQRLLFSKLLFTLGIRLCLAKQLPWLSDDML